MLPVHWLYGEQRLRSYREFGVIRQSCILLLWSFRFVDLVHALIDVKCSNEMKKKVRLIRMSPLKK